jgi:hypothetical protein
VDELGIGWVDAVMLAVIVVSALLGAMRGLTLEVLSLAGWVVAWFAGLWLGPPSAASPVQHVGSTLGVPRVRMCVPVLLVLWGLAARVVSALVGRTMLRPLDRGLGAVFGVLRGGRAARHRHLVHVHAARHRPGVARLGRRGLVECGVARAGSAGRARGGRAARPAQRLTLSFTH